MKINQFIQDAFFSIPKTQFPKKDFKKFVFETLDEFNSRLSDIDNFENISYQTDLIRTRQQYLTQKLKQTLNEYYDGKPAEAYEKFRNGINSSIKDFGELLTRRTYPEGTNFYRIRYHKENYSLPPRELFHIPFEYRGRVKTQRFSIPGFPSLYLATSVYVCWEELKRPSINDFQLIRLKSVNPIEVIDLSPPEMSTASPEEIYNYLMLWPIIFCCSIKVRNSDDIFKPEYIIPQLLLQWVRDNQMIDGVAYQTTHIDFRNSKSEGKFINVVLPVKESKESGMCPILKSKFESTEATSFQLHKAATSGAPFFSGVDDEFNSDVKKIELVKGRVFDYNISSLGDLEGILLSMETKPLN